MPSGPNVALLAPGGNIGKVFLPHFVKAVQDGRFSGLRIVTSRPSEYASVSSETIVPVQATYSEEESLTAAIEGADVVVSTMKNDADTPFVAVRAAAKAKSAKIFITSDYGLDYDAYYSEVPLFAQKLKVVQTGRDLGLTMVPVSIGAFMDWFVTPIFGIDGDNWDIKRDGNTPFAVTHTSDIADYVIRVIEEGFKDPSALPPRVRVYSECKTFNEYADIMEKVTGRKVNRTYTPEETIEKNVKEKGFNYAIQAGLGAPCSDFSEYNHVELLNPGNKYFVPHSFEDFVKSQQK